MSSHALIASAVYAELRAVQPAGFRQATFELEDGVSFIDLVKGDALPDPLTRLEAFGRHRADLDARCEEPPVVLQLREVESYGFR